MRAQESRLLRRDGDAVVVEVTAGAVEHEGRPARQLIIRDITKRKRAEKALRESQERFSSLFDSMLEAVVLHELVYENGEASDYRILDANPAFERETGLSREAVRGGLASEVYGSGAAPYLAEYAAVAEGGEPLSFETYFAPLERHFRIAVVAPGPGRFATIFEDITERKRAEDALRQSSEDLDRAQSVGQVGSWRLDVRSNVLSWSDECYRIFGIPRGTPMTYEGFLEVVHPDDREYLDRSWRAALGGEPYDTEHRLLVDGEVKWVREKAFLEYDETGGLSGGFGITQDVTDRKRAEEKLQALYESQRDIALTLQRSFLHGLPHLDGLDAALIEVPASEPDLVGGDLWDLFELRDGRIVAAIGDVAGKGVPAAGLASTVRSAIHASALVNADPAFVLGNVNRLLLDHHAEGEQFVTALMVVIDREGGALTMASAGHPGPVHLDGHGCALLEPLYGPPLGALPIEYVSSTRSLAGGDYLVLFTDGLSEARRDGELFGDERLIETVRDLYGRTTEDLAATVREAAVDFAGRLRDDLDVMVLRIR
jgi:PAS domain S-box-containing protein